MSRGCQKAPKDLRAPFQYLKVATGELERGYRGMERQGEAMASNCQKVDLDQTFRRNSPP